MKWTNNGFFVKGRFYTMPQFLGIGNDYFLRDQNYNKYPSEIGEEILNQISDMIGLDDHKYVIGMRIYT